MINDFFAQLINGKMQVRTHHLLSNNLLHLEAVLHICDHAPGVLAVERRVLYNTSTNEPMNLVIDIVVHEGDCWVKVFARKKEKHFIGNGLVVLQYVLLELCLLFSMASQTALLVS